jgi:hypothetical protein
MINIQEVKEKLEKLREKYKNEPSKRKIIIRQARLLQYILERNNAS